MIFESTVYNQYINSGITYDPVQSSIVSSASAKVKTGTKPNVTKSKVKKKGEGKDKVPESLEEVFNTENINNTVGDKIFLLYLNKHIGRVTYLPMVDTRIWMTHLRMRNQN